MPMDTLMNYSLEDFNRRCIGWELKFILWPRRCYFSRKLIWMKSAYMGTLMITGPGDAIFDYIWVDPKEYLFQRIKGSI